jgi:transposase
MACPRLASHQKKARRQGADIVFVDETGFSFRARVGLTWAPKGQTPILRRVSKRRELSTIIGLTVSGHLLKRNFKHSIHGSDVVIFLKHLHQRLGIPLIVVWDRLSAHKSKEVKNYLALNRKISLEWLPPYAPDLNPEEACHGNAKQHLRNAAPEDEDEIRRQANREFARIGRDHDLLLSFFRHAGISVKSFT